MSNILSDEEYRKQFAGLGGPELLSRFNSLNAFNVLGIRDPDVCTDSDIAQSWGQRTQFWRGGDSPAKDSSGPICASIDSAMQSLDSVEKRTAYLGQVDQERDDIILDYLQFVPSGSSLKVEAFQKIITLAGKQGLTEAEADRLLRKLAHKHQITLESERPPMPATEQEPPPHAPTAPVEKQVERRGTYDWLEKRNILSSIPSHCWTREASSPTWRLSADFTAYYYPRGDYHAISRDGDPAANSFSVLIFQSKDGSYEISMFSKQAPGDSYDFRWSGGDTIQVARMRQGAVCGRATVGAPAEKQKICLVCSEIEEEIRLDLVSGLRSDTESSRDVEAILAPWKRLLVWFGRIHTWEPRAYQKLPKQVKSVVGQTHYQEAIGRLGKSEIQQLIRLRYLPDEFETLNPTGVAGSQNWIASQVAVYRSRSAGNSPLGKFIDWNYRFNDEYCRGLLPRHFPKIPLFFLKINPSQLDSLDVQAFIAMGALSSQGSLYQKRRREIIERRPDLKALQNQPSGQSLIDQDREIVELKADHEILMESLEQVWVAGGKVGPSPREQARQTGMMIGNIFTGMPIDFGSFYSQRPKWKIYEPD